MCIDHEELDVHLRMWNVRAHEKLSRFEEYFIEMTLANKEKS